MMNENFKYPKKSIREGYGDIAFTRENLLLLHEGKGVNSMHVGKTFTDTDLAALFGCSSWEASYARKSKAYWAGFPITDAESITEESAEVVAEMPKKTKKKKTA